MIRDSALGGAAARRFSAAKHRVTLQTPRAASGPAPLTVPKVASCAAGDTPESALQGQVPAALRASGISFMADLLCVKPRQGEFVIQRLEVH